MPRLDQQTREDLRWASEVLFNTVIGSAWLPRSVRLAALQLVGGRVDSSPGVRFVLVGRPTNLTIGPGCYFNREVQIEAVGRVRIGSGCAIGMQVLIVTSHHALSDGEWSRQSEPRDVVIGDRVWIGARALVLPGVIVEDDVVIAAGAVVAGRCRSGGVYGGVPARRIREL